MPIEVSIQEKKWYVFISKPKISTKKILSTCLKELKIDNYNPIISVVLGNDDLLLHLNSQYKKIEKPTNVLSFCYEDLRQDCCLGEIFVSIDRIVYESSIVLRPIKDHFVHMLIHGLLHILGYDHEVCDEEKKMQALEVSLLKKFGIENPYI